MTTTAGAASAATITSSAANVKNLPTAEMQGNPVALPDALVAQAIPATKPDFSGVWTMDKDRSESAAQEQPIGVVTVAITQTGSMLKVETTRDGKLELARLYKMSGMIPIWNDCDGQAFGMDTLWRRIMKIVLISLLAASLITGVSTVAIAQDTTVIHKESADGERSKTVVKDDNGSKTVIKRHGNYMKKVHTDPNGDKTVIKKSAD